jgi:hypothetical protein
MDDAELGIFEFLAHSKQARVSHYQHRAADLRAKAEAEPLRRNELVRMAKHFEQLAARITMNPRG